MNAKPFLLLAVVMAITHYTHGHAVIVKAKGVGGPEGYALGMLQDTPRDGTSRNPFQRDASIIRDGEIASGRTGPCGRTTAGGPNRMKTGVQSIMSAMGGLPEVAPGKQLTLTVHQVNADGAGPYRCDISMNGSGTDFRSLNINRNLGGILGFSVGGGATPQPLIMTMPENMQCTGGPNGNMCMVRCRNSTPAGPFGGCVPVQQQGSGGGNGTPQTETRNVDDTDASPQNTDNNRAPAQRPRNLLGGLLGGLL